MFTYSLVSTAISDDRRQLRGGMRRLAEIAHKHGIPISWAMYADSAKPFAGDLTEWHESYGDEPLLMLDITPFWGGETTDLSAPLQSAEHIVTMREKLPDYILSEWSKVKREMEWASPVVAGALQKNHILLYALHQAGFKGLWGYRWEEKPFVPIRSGGKLPGETEDFGCPFGFFYPSEERHNFGGFPASRIVGVPYASIDLTHGRGSRSQIAPEGREGEVRSADRTPRSGAPVESFADLQIQILNGTAQRTFEHYAANAEWNRWLAYVQQIDAAEVAALTPEQLERLDAYFASVCRHPETQVMLLSDSVSDYRLGCNQTQPTFLLIEPDLESQAKPGKSMLFYYDAECQLVFEEDQMAPIDMKNYVSPPVKSRYGAEFSLPQIEKFRPSRARNQLRMQFELESTKAMPYGFAVWGNHAGLSLAKSNAHTVTWLGERLLALRCDLQPGKNSIEVVLTI